MEDRYIAARQGEESPTGKHVFRQPRLVLLLALVFTGVTFAQRNAASIFGAVTDSSGAVVAGVSVKAINENTGVVSTATTNEMGNFTLLDLAPGSYTLNVTAQGFKQYVQNNLVLNVDQRPQINIVVQVGDTSESITVRAEVSLVDSTNANLQILRRAGYTIGKMSTKTRKTPCWWIKFWFYSTQPAMSSIAVRQ